MDTFETAPVNTLARHLAFYPSAWPDLLVLTSDGECCPFDPDGDERYGDWLEPRVTPAHLALAGYAIDPAFASGQVWRRRPGHLGVETVELCRWPPAVFYDSADRRVYGESDLRLTNPLAVIVGCPLTCLPNCRYAPRPNVDSDIGCGRYDRLYDRPALLARYVKARTAAAMTHCTSAPAVGVVEVIEGLVGEIAAALSDEDLDRLAGEWEE